MPNWKKPERVEKLRVQGESGMGKSRQLGLLVMVGMLVAATVLGQGKQMQIRRQPLADAPASEQAAPSVFRETPARDVLNGVPIQLEVHHDTEVRTHKPVDVYALTIERQTMNSDGDWEPIGLQVISFYTRYAQDPLSDANPHNGHDCKVWFRLQTSAIENRDPKSGTWPYIEFVKRVDARIIRTREDGAVYWSDDIECWGSLDRFPPF
jgi:hypothetical protein